jgi:hypothetical protein
MQELEGDMGGNTSSQWLLVPIYLEVAFSGRLNAYQQREMGLSQS